MVHRWHIAKTVEAAEMANQWNCGGISVAADGFPRDVNSGIKAIILFSRFKNHLIFFIATTTDN